MSGQVKYCVIFLVCLLSVRKGYANAIDSIKTKEDVIAFIKSNIIIKFHDNISSLPGNDTLNADYVDVSGGYYQADVDSNGKTDLIIAGRWSIVIMNLNSGYIAYPVGIPASLMGCVPYHIISLSDQSTALWCVHQRERYGAKGTDTIYDTLVFKFNGFIEYQPPHAHSIVKKIDFWDKSCNDACDDLHIEINKDGDVVYNYRYRYGGYRYRKADSIENFNAKAGQNYLTDLWNLLSYIDFAKLNDNYFINVSHLSTATLTVYFEDGSAKKIDDYGLAGTLGLRTVYNRLYELQESKDWVKR